MFRLLILNAAPERSNNVLLESEASSVVLPGAAGEFEVLDFHKPVISHLKEGTILVDNQKELKIRGGVAKMGGQSLVVLVEV